MHKCSSIGTHCGQECRQISDLFALRADFLRSIVPSLCVSTKVVYIMIASHQIPVQGFLGFLLQVGYNSQCKAVIKAVISSYVATGSSQAATQKKRSREQRSKKAATVVRIATAVASAVKNSAAVQRPLLAG